MTNPLFPLETVIVFVLFYVIELHFPSTLSLDGTQPRISPDCSCTVCIHFVFANSTSDVYRQPHQRINIHSQYGGRKTVKSVSSDARSDQIKPTTKTFYVCDLCAKKANASARRRDLFRKTRFFVHYCY